MTLKERKYLLIEQITSTDNESVLLKIQELLQASQNNISKDILNLLYISDNCAKSELVEHTSVKDLLKEGFA